MTEAAMPAAVRNALDAANANDTEAFVAAFAPAGAVDDWGRVFRGPADIRTWSGNEFIGVRVSLQVVDVTTAGAETVVSARVGGDGFRGHSTFTFTVDGELVSLMRITA